MGDRCVAFVERGMGGVKRLEFDAFPLERGWDYIYQNDDIQGSEGDMGNSRSSFNSFHS